MKVSIEFDKQILADSFVEIVKETKDMNTAIADLAKGKLDQLSSADEALWILESMELAARNALDINIE